MVKWRDTNTKRRRASRDPKRRFLVVSEDANSAPAYLRALAGVSNSIIDVIGGAGTPEVIAQTAIDHALDRGVIGKKRKGLAWYERTDQVWAVFDRDVHEHFDKGVRLCEENGIHVARSNPCFEVWLILHMDDFHKPHDRHEVLDHLCGMLPDYKHGKGKNVDYGKLLTALEDAEKRAEKQLEARKREGAEYGPPSTTVFRLTRSIWKKRP
ncbi:RloB domain-containing protein [Bradyrhizobium sp. IC3195]|uniref:RloB family protein n=1 Tax=Bradyrhizobium sp. IC3195 TaxID=2793804 RepID=UPI001CD3FE7E|nr:RloB family protein [Bradyrhizobium sp. IC3195]MCA1471933.1 RloB domain-containing protein [Bradyrhizobium sp. IC3195]